MRWKRGQQVKTRIQKTVHDASLSGQDSMLNIPSQRIRAFRKDIFGFYARKGRDLPWRNTADPYAILLSEIMLQQTQVDRVVAYYRRWLRKWPTIHELAEANRADILREWLGLGYNNRAKYLHETARIISEKYKGDVLAALDRHQGLPGIGPYTAAAVRIFSANEDAITVDTNIRRILIHRFKLGESTSDKELWELARRCLPKGRSRDWHNALMDYGAVFLTSRKIGIRPKTRQGKFEGSDRQIRAKMLRYLLNKRASLDELRKMTDCGEPRLRKIMGRMEADALIRQQGNHYCIAEF